MDEENAAVLKSKLELVTTTPETMFEMQFRQAYNILLLGRPHSDGFENEVKQRFDRQAELHQEGRFVAACYCQGKMVITVEKLGRRITKFSIVIRFDSQIFGPRANVDFSFKESVWLALNLNAAQFGYAPIEHSRVIGWTIGRPI
jgi:hypothetical protein